MDARVIECRPRRYCLVNDSGQIWGTHGPLGYWWGRTHDYYGKIWWSKRKAEKQLELLKTANFLE